MMMMNLMIKTIFRFMMMMVIIINLSLSSIIILMSSSSSHSSSSLTTEQCFPHSSLLCPLLHRITRYTNDGLCDHHEIIRLQDVLFLRVEKHEEVFFF